MKTIGLLGGMSWESTREYYRLINEGVRTELGGLNSAKLLLHSFNFAEIAHLQHAGEWDALGDQMAKAAHGLEQAGAEAIIICTNLMHKLAPAVEQNTQIPLIHIADAVAVSIKANNQKKVGLLGAGFTMEEDFYRVRLQEKHGIEVLIPEEEQRKRVHQVIYDELCQGKFTETAKKDYLDIIQSLEESGAEGMILGCTEIPLLITEQDTNIALYDTIALHVKETLRFIFSGDVKVKKAS